MKNKLDFKALITKILIVIKKRIIHQLTLLAPSTLEAPLVLRKQNQVILFPHKK